MLYDHYYRPYRGTITCCCGLQKEDEDGDWTPAKDYISRCDYRGENGNNAAKNYERGCGRSMYDFIPKDMFPEADAKCWTLEHFGKPASGTYEKPKYSLPSLAVTHCESSEGMTGCVLDLDSRDHAESLLLVSSEMMDDPYMVDDVKGCDEIHGMLVSEVGIKLVEFEDLDFALTDRAGKSVIPSVSYIGCYVDNWRRGFEFNSGYITMGECATNALLAGSTTFSMQHARSDGERAQCFYEPKDSLGGEDFPKVPDEECIGDASWQATAFGSTFPYNGAGWRNAVYSLVAPGGEELTTEYRKLEGLTAGDTYHVQVLDLKTCALGHVTDLVVPEAGDDGNTGVNDKAKDETTPLLGVMGRKLMGRKNLP